MPGDLIVGIILFGSLYILMMFIIAMTLREKGTSQAIGNYSITWNFVRRLPVNLRPLTLALIIVVWPIYAVVMLIVGLWIFITILPELVRDFFSEMNRGIHKT
jgi:hypothetical protein